MSSKAKLTEKSKENSVQVILKLNSVFMKRFDETSEQLGYTRTEAIREAMRRFQQQGEKRLMQRPETVAENMRQIMLEVFKPIFEMAAKTQEAEELREINKLPRIKDYAKK